jgi:hypothetical protein
VHGIVGVSQGHVLVAVGIVVPAFLFALSRGGIGVGWIARACGWPALGGAVMAAIILGLERHLGESGPALLAIGATAMAGYTVCVLPSRNRLLGTEVRRGRRRTSAPARHTQGDTT